MIEARGLSKRYGRTLAVDDLRLSQAVAKGRTHRDPDAAPANLSSVSAAALRAEWTKLRTVRSTMWAVAFTVVSTVGLGVARAARRVTSGGSS